MGEVNYCANGLMPAEHDISGSTNPCDLTNVQGIFYFVYYFAAFPFFKFSFVFQVQILLSHHNNLMLLLCPRHLGPRICTMAKDL